MHRFPRRVFTIAGIYGIVVLLPQYFMVERIGRDLPPPITHVEYFYGFIGVALAWQFVFLLIGRDPIRFRPLMLPAILEKLAFAVPVAILFAAGRLPASVALFGGLDFVLGALFLLSWLQTGGSAGRGTAGGPRHHPVPE